MNYSEVYNRLANDIIPEVVQPIDYQEKFYLMKKIKAAIPSMAQDDIYRLIKQISIESKSPMKKHFFIKKIIQSINC